MLSHLLVVCAAKADQPQPFAAHRKGKAEALAFDPAKRAESDFALCLSRILDHAGGTEIEVSRIFEPKPVLGEVDRVLVRVEPELTRQECSYNLFNLQPLD